MRIILTNHARMRAGQRNIRFEDIVECISSPDTITKDDVISCYKKLGGEYLLLVYIKNENNDIVVITVLKTSQIKKYLS